MVIPCYFARLTKCLDDSCPQLYHPILFIQLGDDDVMLIMAMVTIAPAGTFCLPHRSYVAHGCTSSGNKDFQALVCPLCKKTVRFNGSQDPNEQ